VTLDGGVARSGGVFFFYFFFVLQFSFIQNVYVNLMEWSNNLLTSFYLFV
jgi:hypothetical protein